MIDSTPTTDEIRYHATEYNGLGMDEGDFDRWLEEHDRQVAELAWNNAIEFFEDNYYGEVTSASDYNPFRKAES